MAKAPAKKKTTTAAVPAVRSRGGRINAIMDGVLKAISGGGDTVANVATKLAKAGQKVTVTDEKGKVLQVAPTERDVRLAIDKARGKMGYDAIKRIAPKTFQFTAAPAKKGASPKKTAAKKAPPAAKKAAPPVKASTPAPQASSPAPAAPAAPAQAERTPE